MPLFLARHGWILAGHPHIYLESPQFYKYLWIDVNLKYIYTLCITYNCYTQIIYFTYFAKKNIKIQIADIAS